MGYNIYAIIYTSPFPYFPFLLSPAILTLKPMGGIILVKFFNFITFSLEKIFFGPKNFFVYKENLKLACFQKFFEKEILVIILLWPNSKSLFILLLLKKFFCIYIRNF